MSKMESPKVVIIGGGTGSYTLLQGIKQWTPNLTAIVNISDDGGSSGSLRDELGVLPPGDIRQCLVALSNIKQTRDLFTYRFSKGNLSGHAVGNIVLSALELQTGSFTTAVKIMSEFMQITGQVIPVSTENLKLLMDDGGRIIEGETKIGEHKIKNRNAKIYLEPEASINPEAKLAIRNADMVIIAPGNLYRSLLPTLAIKEMDRALQTTRAIVVMIANLVNKPNHTANWHVVDYIKEIEKYIGDGSIDFALFNNELPDKNLLNNYTEAGEFPVGIDPSRFFEVKAQLIGAALVEDKPYSQDPNDKFIKRTLIRHDSNEVTAQLKKLLAVKRHAG